MILMLCHAPGGLDQEASFPIREEKLPRTSEDSSTSSKPSPSNQVPPLSLALTSLKCNFADVYMRIKIEMKVVINIHISESSQSTTLPPHAPNWCLREGEEIKWAGNNFNLEASSPSGPRRSTTTPTQARRSWWWWWWWWFWFWFLVPHVLL